MVGTVQCSCYLDNNQFKCSCVCAIGGKFGNCCEDPNIFGKKSRMLLLRFIDLRLSILTTDIVVESKSKERRQRSGIDTIKYHTRPRIPHGKVTKHNKTPHTREPICKSPSCHQAGFISSSADCGVSKREYLTNRHKTSTEIRQCAFHLSNLCNEIFQLPKLGVNIARISDPSIPSFEVLKELHVWVHKMLPYTICSF